MLTKVRPRLALVGKKGSGKDTLARILADLLGYAPEVTSFAQPLKNMASQVFSKPQLIKTDDRGYKEDIDPVIGMSPRQFYLIVSKAMREVNNNVFVDIVEQKIVYHNTCPPIISDVRFLHEERMLLKHNYTLIRIIGKDCHSTPDELEVSQIETHRIVFNLTSIQDLKKIAEALLDDICSGENVR